MCNEEVVVAVQKFREMIADQAFEDAVCRFLTKTTSAEFKIRVTVLGGLPSTDIELKFTLVDNGRPH